MTNYIISSPFVGDVFASPVQGEIVQAVRVDSQFMREGGKIVTLFRVKVVPVEGNSEPRWTSFRALKFEDGKAFARAI